jgi:quinoprotein glucose dehydrogenase
LANIRNWSSKGLKDTGCENYGGPVVTAGGVLFIAATIYDRKIRTFDSHTGTLLRSADLPYRATPSTYMIDGRQFLVIAASGQRDVKGPQGAPPMSHSRCRSQCRARKEQDAYAGTVR